MSEMKSAREIAMEKIARLGEATQEERLRWKYVPDGEKLAAGYLKHDCELATGLSKYEKDVVKYVIEGVAGVLIRNIGLPRDEVARKNNKRAMDGLKEIKSDKVALENVFSQLRRIFSHYTGEGEQQRRQAYEALKAEFQEKIQQALQQQVGLSVSVPVDVERQPQFQEEWRRMRMQLDSQYIVMLSEFQQALGAIV